MIPSLLRQGPFYLILFAIAGCSQTTRKLVSENPTSLERKDELVQLSRSMLEKKIGKISDGEFADIHNLDGSPVLVQFDDLDADNQWDEALLLLNTTSNETKEFNLTKTSGYVTAKPVVRAGVRHRKLQPDRSFGESLIRDTMPVGAQATDFSKQKLPPYLTEGPGWENDKLGFRLYFDVRNGKDIWGKKTSALVLDNVGTDTTANYHKEADWGMDLLKVGKSLGAGSLAISFPHNGNDTLVRLGGEQIGRVVYQQIANGPLRAVFRLIYTDWKLAEGVNPVQLTEEISIWAGQYFYESKVTVKGAPDGAKLVTGIVNLHNQDSERIDTAGQRILYTHGLQSENKDQLGMAIMVSNEAFDMFDATPNSNAEILNTYTVAMNISDNNAVYFRFYAGWEKSDPRFSTADGFRSFLIEQAIKKASPIKISL